MPKKNDDLYKKALLYIESGRMDMASKPTKSRKIQLPNGVVVHVHEGVLDFIEYYKPCVLWGHRTKDEEKQLQDGTHEIFGNREEDEDD